jgi:putative ABC transport system permease protein
VREISVDGWVVGFTFLVSLLVGVLFGLVPALQASKPDLNEALKEGTRSATASASRNRVRNFLVISEVALALVLLAGASLMIKSFLRLRAVELGFQPEKVLTAEVALPATRYAQERQQAAFYQQLLGRIEALPGVESASATSLLPLTGSLDDPLSIEGRPFNPNEPLVAAYSTIGPHYFRALGVPLLKGRDFTEQDAEEAPRAVIINQTMARQFWPGEDPIGKRFTLGLPRPSNPWLSVVGVVGDVRHRGLDTEPRPQWYRTYLQSPRLRMTLVVRAAGDPASLTAAVRNAVRSVDQDQPVSNVMTMPEIVAESISPRRFQMLLLGLFAALALILAVMGIYGVISYSVAQRTHEIGVRMALGARPRDVLRLIVGQGLMLALIGVGLGLAAAFALTRVIASLLYGVSATDPASFATTSLLLMITALLASYLPARRAMKIAPVVALRYE